MPATPEIPAGGFEPDDVVPWTLVRAGHALSRVFTQELDRLGLKPHIFGILVHLQREPGLSSAELARRILVTPQSMGKLLRGLADEGLIEHPPPRRGQRMRVHLSPRGAELLGRAWPVVGRMNEPASLGLTPSETRQLNALLHRVLAATNVPTYG